MENNICNPYILHRSKWLLLSDRACNLAEQIREFYLQLKSEGFVSELDFETRTDKFIETLLDVRSELDHYGFEK